MRVRIECVHFSVIEKRFDIFGGFALLEIRLHDRPCMAAKGVFEHVQRKPVDFKHEVKSQRDSVGIVQMFKRVFDLFEFPLLQLLTAVFFAHDRGWRKLWAGGFEGTVIQDVLLSRQSTRKRSEEHTSELQSRGHLVCRLLLEKKQPITFYDFHSCAY